jgi:curli biogenesis system outer membrane secretion channel CsgG
VYKTFLLFVVLSCFLVSCATVPTIDPTALPVDKGPREVIPNACRPAYESSFPKIAVVNFSNNTPFENMNIIQSHLVGSGYGRTTGGASVGITPRGPGAVWGTRERSRYQQNAEETQRQVSAKLTESIEDSVTDDLVNMGGMKIFTRTEMEKILSEQKFQQSGLVDEATLVSLGKLVGVKYIVTGSINNVELSYTSYESARRGSQDAGRVVARRSEDTGTALAGVLIGTVIAATLETMEGWNVSTEVTLRMLDVETGQVLFSDKVSGKQFVGKSPKLDYDAVIGGIKKAASKGLETARPKLSAWFTVKGYIRQIRTSPDEQNRYANLSIGNNMGLKPGSKLIAYTFEELEDENPLTGEKKTSCNRFKLPVQLIVTDQVQADNSWATIEGSPEGIKRVKVGQLVERMPLTQ